MHKLRQRLDQRLDAFALIQEAEEPDQQIIGREALLRAPLRGIVILRRAGRDVAADGNQAHGRTFLLLQRAREFHIIHIVGDDDALAVLPNCQTAHFRSGPALGKM